MKTDFAYFSDQLFVFFKKKSNLASWLKFETFFSYLLLSHVWHPDIVIACDKTTCELCELGAIRRLHLRKQKTNGILLKHIGQHLPSSNNVLMLTIWNKIPFIHRKCFYSDYKYKVWIRMRQWNNQQWNETFGHAHILFG